MTDVAINHITVNCSDGFDLAATCFTPQSKVKAAVMIGPATGIKRQFYESFARFLAESGYGVITFDNRGIGQSAPSKLRHCLASLQCWGERDMPAVLSHLKQVFPDVSYHLLGHSAGGQLVGLMPNSLDLTSVFNVACSSGQLRNMAPAQRVKANFFMNVFIPMSNLLFGHTKSQWLDMGEPLPKKVAQQWRFWCNGKSYVKMAFGKTITKHFYGDLVMPTMWLNATDDEIANEKNAIDMATVFPNLPIEMRFISPAEYGLNEIGHMKFFSRKSQKLWQIPKDWLEQHR